MPNCTTQYRFILEHYIGFFIQSISFNFFDSTKADVVNADYHLRLTNTAGVIRARVASCHDHRRCQ